MSHDLISALHRDGFVVLDRYLDDRTTSSLSQGCADIGEAALARRGVVYAQRNMLANPVVSAFAASEPARRLVDSASPGAVAVRAILFDKTGDANWTVPWHQDRSIAVARRLDLPGFGPWSVKAGVVHVQPPADLLRAMVTLRFSLDPCGLDNGPLRVIPRTHHEMLDAAAVDRAVADGAQHTCTTSAGGVVVMRPLVLHASSPADRGAGSPSHRRVLHIEYGPPVLPGGLQWAAA